MLNLVKLLVDMRSRFSSGKRGIGVIKRVKELWTTGVRSGW